MKMNGKRDTLYAANEHMLQDIGLDNDAAASQDCRSN